MTDAPNVDTLEPIEKVIGWTPHDDDSPHCRLWVTADGRIRERAEVEDLLEWLRDRDDGTGHRRKLWPTVQPGWPPSGGWEVSFFDADRGNDVVFSARSARDALTQAVRHVSSARSVAPDRSVDE